MAPIKFEEQLKDKLEKRSLQPSAESWAKLSERLDTEEKKSKKPLFWWMGIAASIIILIVVAVQVFGSDEIELVEPFIVNEEVNEQNQDQKQPNANEVESTKLVIEESKNKDDIKEKATEKPQKINYEKLTKSNGNIKTQFANTTLDIKNEDKSNQLKNEQQSIIQESIINKEDVANVIREIQSKNNTTVSDTEIDSLLKLANKELFRDKLKENFNNTVDANLLLLEVEEEMGQSFRTKVYEALKESYETVKTAVAGRNN